MTRTQLIYFSVDPGRSACLRCDESDIPGPAEHSSAAVAHRLTRDLRLANGLTGPMAMQVGSLVSYEVMRYLTGIEPPRAAGCRVVLDLRNGLIPVWQPFPRDPACPACALARS
jgi:hypothetical protein